MVTLVGGSFLISYWSDYSSNLGTLSTNVNAGWSSNIISGARIEMYIAPNFFGKDSNLLELVLWGSAYTNKSTDNATFILIVPFCIKSIVNRPANSTDSQVFSIEWSIQNIGSNASVVYCTLKPIPNNYSMPYFDNVNVLIDLRFTQLTAIDNRGSYTVTIPFGEGISPNVANKIRFTSSYPFPVDLTKNITFGFLLKGGLVFTSSFPEFASQNFDNGLPYHGGSPSESLLSLNYHLTSSLTITFQDSDEVNSSFFDQAFGFTLLGVGIPITISAIVELVEKKKVDQ